VDKKVLVTGGAGFIGSHLVDRLISLGYEVRVFDSLEPQVHGKVDTPPEYLSKKCHFIRGDLRDRERLGRALKGIEVIFHQAALVGVGQSMYEIKRYMEINSLGTANLLDILANEKHSTEKLIVASSMSIYGEGKYSCKACGLVYPKLRSREQLRRQEWEMVCPICGKPAKDLPTDEEKPLFPTSTYAISKRDQEELCLTMGWAYGIPTIALRYFNAYGPRQALSNPYTGMAAIFSSRILNNNPPLIFEDGHQSRDFIHVSDVVEANLLAMGKDEADYEVLNVGTGRASTVLDVAGLLAKKLNSSIHAEIVKKYRLGDIRHCYADTSKIKEKLGFEPRVRFEDGILGLAEWVRTQEATDQFEKSRRELEERSLIG